MAIEIPSRYLLAVNEANFVSIKLSKSNYSLWKAQIVCLLESQELVGFVDGTITSPLETDGLDYLQWKKSDRFVKGLILGSLTEQVLRDVLDKATARDVWLELDHICNPQFEEDSDEEDYNQYLPLYRASLDGTWEKAEAFFNRDNNASRAPLNSFLQTALHVAVGAKNDNAKHFVEKLVASMADDPLDMTDCLGSTPLHYAARFGNLHAAKILVARNKDLPNIGCDGLFPIHDAAEYGYNSMDVYIYLLGVTTVLDSYTGSSGIRLLRRLIHSDMYDFATELVTKHPDLAKNDTDERSSALKELAMKEFAFRSGSRLNCWQQSESRLNCWQRLFFSCQLQEDAHERIRNDIENVTNERQMLKPKNCWFSPICERIYFITGESYQRIYFITAIKKLGAFLFVVLEKIVPPLKHNKKHYNALKLAECLCEKIESLSHEEVVSIVSRPLLEAARYGSYELVEIIVRKFPSLVHFTDRSGKNIFHIAIEHRCENVFNLVYQMSQHRHQLMISIDSSRNTMLHLAGKLAPQNKLNLVSGPALHMQRELQWFKAVKKLVPPSYWEFGNNEDKIPAEVFTKEHAELKINGEEWMKATANSCTIAAALVATIAFAAAITVPGGNNNESGLPIFSRNSAFSIFAISNAASLFASSTSMLVFLSVLTSRYAEEDFLYALPRSLILGLFTLFLSITLMTLSFSATVYLVSGQRKSYVLVPVATLACLPIISFVLMQFPLLAALISSTYGRGIFGKKSNRPFY
ncbi:uncharacterized protein LOC107812838 isoform X2 [Nicotiana tabacum]|uniref:Uncharacterized protein LOC107812838 isoform X2 n=1 Tax=Nicotiana tabacum TaxID=4097 RepID=A0A1S4BX67_TOBAC|nr:PREDICTED: uncharacterized protein LOC107812838 isoform X2 [Nicotiana tabacum]